MSDRCDHDFRLEADVFVFQDRPPLAQVDLRGHCAKCKAAIEFIGMECGVNMGGPAVSVDQREAHLAAVITNEPASVKFSGAKVRMI